ncbi:MAG: ABC transporter ATP-binding protein [Bradyrhizobiaceae bacterium]|nr:ABC transporter ATP-binding protein [Bradyrhizobiaceae bacterium]
MPRLAPKIRNERALSCEGAVPILTVEGLGKNFGEQVAIADISFVVKTNEVLGIIGPNGAGKTTLLETVAGHLSADTGVIYLRGEELSVAHRRNAIFYVPDGVRPYPDQFVATVVSFLADVYRRTENELADVVRLTGLTPVLGKRVHALSKGYARRLLLALGLLAPHQLVLMDEPFDGFDLRQTREVMGVLRNEASLGRSLVLAIHQLADAERVCDRFMLLSAGRICAGGTLDELRAHADLPNAHLEEIFLALT